MILLFVFPFNLIWGGIIAWYYQPIRYYYALFLLPLITAIITFFMPFDLRIAMWMPDGFIPILLSSLYMIPYHFSDKKDDEVLYMSPPPLKVIRERIREIQDVEERKSVLVKFLSDMAVYFQRKTAMFSDRNTRFILFGSLLTFAVTYSGLSFHFFSNGNYESFFIDRIAEAEKVMNLQLKEEDKALGLELMTYLSPAILFVTTVFFFLITSSALRIVSTLKRKRALPFGNLIYFVLPSAFIWFFIASGVLFLFTQFYPLGNPEVKYIPLNILIVLSLLYIMQGAGTITLFFQVRLIPAIWIFVSIILISLFFSILMSVFLFILLLVGLFEFFFSFRNKALQPNLEL